MPATRTILHADMDAFYAAVEQRDRFELRGKPVVVGGTGPRGVVSTASYEARRFGVRSAMPMAEARRRCPDAVFVRGRMAAYAEVSRQIRAVFDRFTPLVEPLSLDEAFLDVTASEALFGDGPSIAAAIRDAVRRTTGLTVSVGVATSKYVAKVASDLGKPDGLTVVPAGGEAAFLAPLPVARLWGAGPRMQARLARHGLRTIGDLQRLDEPALVAMLGEAAGRHFHRLCRGDDPRAVEPQREAKSIGHETTFDTDLHDREDCHAVLLALAERVGRRLRRDGLVAATVRLKLRLSPFRTLTRQRRAAPATADDLELAAAAREMFDAAWSGRDGVRLLGVTAAELRPAAAPVQQELFGAAPSRHRSDRLGEAIDALRERFGDSVIRRGGSTGG